MNELEIIAKRIACKAHEGQFRRDGITPYFTHPQAVAEMVSENAKPIAWLHDVLEDNPAYSSRFLLLSGLPDYVVNSVVALTKHSTDNYFDYISNVMRFSLAREVKIADISHNLMSDPKPKNIIKYRIALAMLRSDVTSEEIEALK